MIDTGTLKVVRTIALAGTPGAMAPAPDGNRVYAADFGGRFVLPFDTRTVTFATARRPEEAALSPDGRRLYVTGAGDGTVAVTSTRPVTVAAGRAPSAVGVSPDGREAYAVDFDGGVLVLDTTAGAVSATVAPGGAGARVLALSHDGKRLYAAGQEQLTVIDTARREVLATVAAAADPGGVAVARDGSRVFVTDQATDAVLVFRTDPPAADGVPVPVGQSPQAAVLSPDGRHLYVGNVLSHDVSVVDTVRREVVATVHIGSRPSSSP